MSHYLDPQDVRRVTAQIVQAHQHLPRTGFPQDAGGAAALRARAVGELLEALADELKSAGLTAGGQIPPDVQMLSRLRDIVDETVTSMVFPHAPGQP